jgi:hypothetical protein
MDQTASEVLSFLFTTSNALIAVTIGLLLQAKPQNNVPGQ